MFEKINGGIKRTQCTEQFLTGVWIR